jgi:CHAT domain-containing protein
VTSYELLIRPIEKELSGAKALLIVPDEVLWRVPFSALVDANGRFLVERTPIVYAPSITAYATMMHIAPRHAPHAFFGVANPSLTTHDALPEAKEEIEAVRALYGARNSKVLEGNAATESRTRAELGKASIIHFATHALLDDAHPMYSRLLLARDPGANDDGSLEAWEIAQLHLSADLIILSACNTARGSISHGEGVVGMVWAFFVAGARSTVATQWSVASGSTAKLMIAFHRSLRRGDHDPALAKAEALRDAQLELLRNARDTHPFAWAGFALYGDASYRLSTHPAFVF